MRKHLFKTQSECGLLVEKLNKEEEKLEDYFSELIGGGEIG